MIKNIVKVDVYFELIKDEGNFEDIYATFDNQNEAEELESECIGEVGWKAVDEFCYWISKALNVEYTDVYITDSKYGVYDTSPDNYITFEIENCKMSKQEIKYSIESYATGREESYSYTYELTDVNGSGKSCDFDITLSYRLGKVADIYY